jgi:hypothetical protein
MLWSAMRSRSRIGRQLPVLLLSALVLGGCHDLDRFDTTSGDAYCGSIVTAPFIRDASYPPNMRMQLHLDTSSLTTAPGDLTTDDALCSSGPLFKSAQMRALDEVQSDPISQMQFGEGREHNFFAWVDTTCQGTVLAVVSLMKNDDVEVRLLKPEPAPPAGEKPHSGFAVFLLKRHKGDCGYSD